MQHPLDSKLIVNNTLMRKAMTYSLVAFRKGFRPFCSSNDYRSQPRVLVNSIPKSGTHLLLQIARSLPNSRYYGHFVNWANSLTLQERSQSTIMRMLSEMAPREVAGGHLYYSKEMLDFLRRKNISHWMIIRDPVDIVLSEVHYLQKMNWRHRMAKEFRGLCKENAIDLCVNGSKNRPDLYPNLETRLRPYIDWIGQESVTLVRYEDLTNEEIRKIEIERLISTWAKQVTGSKEISIEGIVNVAEKSIAPEKSHTYSGRRSDGAIKIIREDLVHRLKDIRHKCGYASDSNS